MAEKYTVSLQKIAEELNVEPIYLPRAADEILVDCENVNRPGLPLAGFYDHYDPARIQIIGRVEFLYLSQLPPEARAHSLEVFFASRPVAVIVTRSQDIGADSLALARRYEVPVLRTADNTSSFTAALIAYLNVCLAPRITRHGVLVEVYGEGVLLLGESGVGKSEAAIELVKRGHRLIADDAVQIKRVSAKTLVGEAPDIIRHYVELRGIGVVDVRRIFGMGAVKQSEKIDLVINLEQWEEGKMYDRLGLDEQRTEILGISVPSIVIPVRPGRNLAVIIEIAAMNNRLKKMGYNTPKEFSQRLMDSMKKE
ncbi:MAG: HPr(Ser) kinase/phosphatase [Clostridia bacterium]|nr:HPr(Ser) kinase/phosphatase [Clostridia bacterium]